MELKLIVAEKAPLLPLAAREDAQTQPAERTGTHLPAQLPDPWAEQCLPIVSWLRSRPRALKNLYPDRDLGENEELLKPGILLQTALYVAETSQQIRLCTDGSTAPVVNCGTRA